MKFASIIIILTLSGCKLRHQYDFEKFSLAIQDNFQIDSVRIFENKKNLDIECYTFLDSSDYDNEMTISLITCFLGKHYFPDVIPLEKKVRIKLIDSVRTYESELNIAEVYHISAIADSALIKTVEIFNAESNNQLINNFRNSSSFSQILEDTEINRFNLNGLVRVDELNENCNNHKDLNLPKNVKTEMSKLSSNSSYRARMRIEGVNSVSIYLYFDCNKELIEIKTN